MIALNPYEPPKQLTPPGKIPPEVKWGFATGLLLGVALVIVWRISETWR